MFDFGGAAQSCLCVGVMEGVGGGGGVVWCFFFFQAEDGIRDKGM